LASRYYGGRRQQQIDLEKEGIEIRDFKVVDFVKLRWDPFESEKLNNEK